MVTTEQINHFSTGDGMCVKVLVEVFYHTCFEVEISKHSSIFDALDSAANSAKESEFLTAKANLLTLDIAHFQSQFIYKKMIHK